MNCKHAQIQVLTSDGRLSLLTHLHLLRCPNCAREARQLERAQALLRTMPLPPAPDLSDSIMAALRFEQDPLTEKTISIPKWLLVGAVILAGLVLAPFSTDSRTLSAMLGSDLGLVSSITLAGVLTLYASVFIASHLEQLTHRMDGLMNHFEDLTEWLGFSHR